MTDLNDLKTKLTRLQLKAMASSLDSVLADAQAKNTSILHTISQLADLELERRRQSAIKLRWDQSKLPDKPTIDQFDFEHHKSRKDHKNQILHLLDLEFIKERMDVVLIGNPGTGKTFLANCIGGAACNANVKVLFTTAMDMINHLIAAEADHSLLKKLQYYQSADLLCVDEIGYLSLGQQGSHLFFQVISARHQKKSTLLTTNLPFADWGKVFDSTTVATAIADRLVFRSEILILGGSSYRRKVK
ncbi:IS21-like element helper ATPase IstB [Desulforhabdus sp. TSK]|uniref:IS21-like element helper ATPase IstB n=1 Tax=Desulforhabdus sp. TSK TaxID=2925014 RepID=UPI001FC83529|nr:IS21-like element helper ATPase IstB [Desulforhabdus sp. TSK]GKT10996.1 ATPase AAA [Desulforhabdus sp. TSK]